MEASNSAMTGLRALRDVGVQVGLDDFGTGYSSLAYLRQFPLDFVKIDKSFIDDLDIDPRYGPSSGAIIVLSHALGLTVVAEGVEPPSQREPAGPGLRPRPGLPLRCLRRAGRHRQDVRRKAGRPCIGVRPSRARARR